MSKVDQSEYIFAKTLKAVEVKEPFITSIKEEKEVSTRFGVRRVLVFDMYGEDAQAYINAECLEGLVTAFGDETTAWIGKQIEVSTKPQEKDNTKLTIVIKPSVTVEEKVK